MKTEFERPLKTEYDRAFAIDGAVTAPVLFPVADGVPQLLVEHQIADGGTDDEGTSRRAE